MAVIPEQVRDYGPEAAIVIAHLDYLTRGEPDGVSATTAALAEGTGLAARTVQRVTTRLRDLGVIASTRTGPWDSTQRWSVLVSPGHAGNATVAVSGVRDGVVPGPRDRVVSQNAKVAVSPLGLEVGEETPPTPPETEDGTLALLTVVPDPTPTIEEEFGGFWAVYPRRVGKATALVKYRAARRTASVADIAGGLRAQLPDLLARPMDKVPHPATWLHQRRWEDDPAHAAQAVVASGPRNVLLDPHLMDLPAVGGAR